MTIVQCMGGFCQKRQQCAHYFAPGLQGREPIERLCAPGHDEPEPIRVIPVRQEVPA